MMWKTIPLYLRGIVWGAGVATILRLADTAIHAISEEWDMFLTLLPAYIATVPLHSLIFNPSSGDGDTHYSFKLLPEPTAYGFLGTVIAGIMYGLLVAYIIWSLRNAKKNPNVKNLVLGSLSVAIILLVPATILISSGPLAHKDIITNLCLIILGILAYIYLMRRKKKAI